MGQKPIEGSNPFVSATLSVVALVFIGLLCAPFFWSLVWSLARAALDRDVGPKQCVHPPNVKRPLPPRYRPRLIRSGRLSDRTGKRGAGHTTRPPDRSWKRCGAMRMRCSLARTIPRMRRGSQSGKCSGVQAVRAHTRDGPLFRYSPGMVRSRPLHHRRSFGVSRHSRSQRTAYPAWIITCPKSRPSGSVTRPTILS